MPKNNFLILTTMLVVSTVFISSCNTEPDPIMVSVDQCFYCKMMVSDVKFGAEIITVKGKKIKFDDAHCVLAFINTKMIQPTEIKEVYLTDFSALNHPLIKATDALLLQSDLFKSPMNGNIAAFGNADSMNKIKSTYRANAVSWNQLVK